MHRHNKLTGRLRLVVDNTRAQPKRRHRRTRKAYNGAVSTQDRARPTNRPIGSTSKANLVVVDERVGGDVLLAIGAGGPNTAATEIGVDLSLLGIAEQTVQLFDREIQAFAIGQREQLPLCSVGPTTTAPVSDGAVPDTKGTGYPGHATESVNQVHDCVLDTKCVLLQALNEACVLSGSRHDRCMTTGKKTPFNVAAGWRLAKLRMALGLDQEAFGKLLGKSRAAIGNYEQGTRRLDPETMVLLYDKWKVTTDYIYRNDFDLIPHHLAMKIQVYPDRPPVTLPSKRKPKVTPAA